MCAVRTALRVEHNRPRLSPQEPSVIRLQIIDPDSRFACGSCTACCDQPWRTMIETDKAHTLDRHDFSKYPQLAGKKFYHAAADGREGFFDLAKGEGTRCLFLDTDGKCIIHKELGPEAKPHMCRQFPFLSSRTWMDERVSANFGCPSIQSHKGNRLTEQTQEIAATVALSGRAAEPYRRVPLTANLMLTQEECDRLIDRALTIFSDGHSGDIWSRFAELLALIAAVGHWKKWQSSEGSDPELIEALRNGDLLDHAQPVEAVTPFDQPSAAPLSVRILFAATLQPDTIPAGVVGSLSLLGRFTAIPRLMALAKLSGGYASRLLGRNVNIRAVLTHPIEQSLDAASTDLLLRYFRARFWQRMIAGTRLPIVAGIHQHIHDFNAILFYARAMAHQENSPRLTEPHIRKSLTLVEFHLANQPRLFDQTLKGWLRSQLNNVGIASQSLRLMAPVAVGTRIVV